MSPAPASVTIGRAPTATIPIAEPSVSWHHATIEATPQGHVLRDEGSSSGTFVNGLRTRTHRLEPGDIVQVGPVVLVYDGAQLVRADGSIGGVDIEVRRLTVELGGQPILRDVSATIARNEFTAVIGGSGSGKSTLLRAISGILPATSGDVLYNGQGITRSLDAFRPLMGFVPQRDIVHPLLTVRGALGYAAQLRLPADWSAEARSERIEEVVERVGLEDRIDHQIGRLSGGQVKRVSVALELLGNPRVLFLDEPTSGLDPGLDKRLMGLFRSLADGNRTVVVVTHATAHLDECDRVLMLAPGGRLVYDGDPVTLPRRFGVDTYADAFTVVEREPDSIEPLPASAPRRRDVAARTAWPRHRVGFGRCYRVVARRSLELALRDRRNLAILLLQAPVIGLILAAVGGEGAFGDPAAPIGSTQTIAFALALVAIWFGLINAIREIVKERPIADRERLAGLRGDAYVLAKLTPLLLLTGAQCLLLVALITPRTGWPDGGLVVSGFADAFVSLLLLGLASVAVAFVVSALAANEDQAASTIPFLLIPQFLLAGVVFPLGDIASVVSRLMIGRWGAEAVGGSVMICEHAPNAAACEASTRLDYPVTSGELLQTWALLGVVAILLLAVTALVLERQRARV
jgi:ABC-type multidrug transport system ATPase subunit